jgi:hypothetical protein
MRKINLRSAMLITLSALIICIAGCANNPVFSGSKTGNDNQFLVDFDAMNTTLKSDMLLSEGDFTIVIEEAGTYTFSITGLKAEGSVYLIKSLIDNAK